MQYLRSLEADLADADDDKCDHDGDQALATASSLDTEYEVVARKHLVKRQTAMHIILLLARSAWTCIFSRLHVLLAQILGQPDLLM